MRRLLIPLIASIALTNTAKANWLGKYGSRYEALEACQNWIRKGKVYFIEYETYKKKPYNEVLKYVPVLEKSKFYSRSCKIEIETNQFLWFEKAGVKDSETYESDDKFQDKLKKYFKF